MSNTPSEDSARGLLNAMIEQTGGFKEFLKDIIPSDE
jgi:hypothetical protein